MCAAQNYFTDFSKNRARATTGTDKAKPRQNRVWCGWFDFVLANLKSWQIVIRRQFCHKVLTNSAPKYNLPLQTDHKRFGKPLNQRSNNHQSEIHLVSSTNLPTTNGTEQTRRQDGFSFESEWRHETRLSEIVLSCCVREWVQKTRVAKRVEFQFSAKIFIKSTSTTTTTTKGEEGEPSANNTQTKHFIV